MKFPEALAEGKKSEKIIEKLIQIKYPQAKRKTGYFKPRDIKVPEIDSTVEVKRDFKSQETGNLVIETFMNGNPSGLASTEADWWVFHPEEDQLIWIKPDLIKDMILKHGFKQVEFIGSGDEKPKKAYLVPKIIVINCSNKINSLKRTTEFLKKKYHEYAEISN